MRIREMKSMSYGRQNDHRLSFKALHNCVFCCARSSPWLKKDGCLPSANRWACMKVYETSNKPSLRGIKECRSKRLSRRHRLSLELLGVSWVPPCPLREHLKQGDNHQVLVDQSFQDNEDHSTKVGEK